MPVTLDDLRLPIRFDLTDNNPLGDYSIYRGDKYTLTLFVESCGSRISLAAFVSGKAEIRDALDGTLLASATVTIEASSETGRIDIVWPSSETDALPSTGVWDVALVDGSGDQTTIFFGATEARRDVSGP